MALNRCDAATAGPLFEQSLALFQNVGDQLGAGYALCGLGRVAHREGDDRQAAAHFEAAVTIRREAGDRRGLVECVEDLAMLASGTRRSAPLAARLFGAASAARGVMGAPLPPALQGAYDRAITTVHDQLGDDAFAGAWADGLLLPLERAVAEALTVVPEFVLAPHGLGRSASPDGEREAADLLDGPPESDLMDMP